MKATLFLNVFIVSDAARRAMHSATVRQHQFEKNKTVKTPDLDWKGCAAFTGCKKQLGCTRKYLWLDSPRQSCRYTDEHKLQRDQILTFFPVEIARLEEKSVKFAKHGCITGGWWFKCYRRMQQILRLFNYVRKAQGLVLAEGKDHPAFAFMNDSKTQQQFKTIAENLGSGFEKNGETGKLSIGSGLRRMMSVQLEMQKIQDEATAKGVPLTEEELSTIEQSKQTAALLAINGQDVTDEQAEKLRAMMEASGQGKTVKPTAGQDEIDDIVQEQEETIMALDDDDREAVRDAAQEKETDDDDQDADDDELHPPSLMQAEEYENEYDQQANSSLIQLSARDGPLKKLVKGGWKGLKWVVGHGVGWLFRRLVWTVAFLVGFTFSFVRAVVIWPIALLMCGSVRSISWLFGDVLWEGQNQKEGFKRIGHCAPEMWNAVGFDSNNVGKSLVNQTIKDPAKDASWMSGVYHPYKSGKPEPCARVTCGANAQCATVGTQAKCFCSYGYYPASDGQGGYQASCQLKQTANNCQCEAYWSSWGVGYYGCNKNGECKVTSACKASLGHQNITSRIFKAAVGMKTTIDKCQFTMYPSEVPAASINKNIDAFGKPVAAA